MAVGRNFQLGAQKRPMAKGQNITEVLARVFVRAQLRRADATMTDEQMEEYVDLYWPVRVRDASAALAALEEAGFAVVSVQPSSR